jgi:hypothetical protein
MKKTILIIASLLFVITMNAQKIKESEVPATIKTAFAKQFPGMKVEKWEKENGAYEAEFDNEKVETSVLFDNNGALLATEKKIEISELPLSVVDYVSKNLTGKKIKEASIITDAKETVTYEAEVDKVDYIFDSKGKFIKESKD